MSVKIEKIVDPVVLGEGPHWDEKQQCLFFVSILDKTIHKYVPASKECTKTTLNGRVGFIVPVDGTTDQFLVGLERKFVIVQWDGKEGSKATEVREIGEVDKEIGNTRINDGKADPRGRVYAGTMGYEEPLGNVQLGKGSLYRIDGGSIEQLADKIGISNGLAWDLQEKAFYYTDSLENDIRRYDYDVSTGDIRNKQYIFDFKKNNIDGVPDGTTIDTDGNLWVACFGGGVILHINPRTGKLINKIAIPAKQVTSVTFGGPNYDILFVTSASFSVMGAPAPIGGATYMITGLGVKGLPNINFKP